MDKVKRTESSVNIGKSLHITYMTPNKDFLKVRLLGVVWSSNEVHMVDALAVRGDERRDSLR